MTKRTGAWLSGIVLIVSLMVGLTSGAVSSAQGEEAMVTVLNPLGKPPAITLVPMASVLISWTARSSISLQLGFPTTDVFMRELAASFAKAMPKVKTEFRQKIGSFFDDDPKLWAEVKEKGGVVVLRGRPLRRLYAGGRRPLSRIRENGYTHNTGHHEHV